MTRPDRTDLAGYLALCAVFVLVIAAGLYALNHSPTLTRPATPTSQTLPNDR